MGEDKCVHPRSKIQLAPHDDAVDYQGSAPRYVTFAAECECGEVVEVEYEFHKILS